MYRAAVTQELSSSRHDAVKRFAAEAPATAAKTVSMTRGETAGVFAVLMAAVSARLVNISQPFIDTWSWRQSDNAMIADNFYRYGFNFLYPQMSYTGNTPGYVGSEFPLITSAAALLYVPFGVAEWIGRSISIFFSAASMPLLYLLVKKISNRRSALFAIAVYALAPLSVFAGRSFIADVPMVSLSIAALYFFAEWLERPKLGLFLAAAGATSLAILVKLPAAIIGLPLLYLAWQAHGPRLVLRRELWLFALIALLPPAAWYYHSYVVSLTSFPLSLFWQPGVLTRQVGLDEYAWIARRTAVQSLTPLVSVLALAGIFLGSGKRFGWLFHWWLAADVLFIWFAGDGNVRHPWYQLPLVPVAAAFAGLACDRVLRKLDGAAYANIARLWFGVIFLATLAYLSYRYTRPMYRSWQLPAWNAGGELDRIAPADALVLVATDDCDPTPIYYTRRRGWHFLEENDFCAGPPADSRQAIENLENLRRRGASYLVFPLYTRWWLNHYHELRRHLDSRYRRVRESKDYVIFDLSGPGSV